MISIPIALEDAGVLVLDCEHKTPRAQSAGHPYIAIPDIQDGRVILDQARLISGEDLAEWTRRTVPTKGDILVTRRGRVGDTAPVPNVPCAIGQNLVLLRSDGERVNADYLRWAVRSPEWWSEVERLRNVGAVFSSLNVRDIGRIRLSLPPLPEQQAIAEVLGALDDKIAANAALSDTALEYVDRMFPLTPDADPVRLGDVVSVTKGNSYKSADLAPSDHALVSLKSVTRDGRFTTHGLKQFVGKYKTEQVVAPNEIVVAQTDLTHAAEVVGRAVRVPGSPYLTLVASLDLAIVRPSHGMNPTYLLGLLRQASFREHCRTNTTGTTVLHLRSGAIEEFAAMIPASAVQEKYASAADPLLRVVDAAAAENRTLAATRDSLLPQLMSGKLRVRDAEDAASRAGA